MFVVGQIRRCHRNVDPGQVDRHVVREMRLVDDGHGDGTVDVDVGAHVQVLGAARGLDPHGTGAGEAKVRCKRPQSSRDVIMVVLESDEGVVPRRVLGAPPVRVARGVRVDKGVVHVQGPLEALTVVGK